jgi:hypothetical protein
MSSATLPEFKAGEPLTAAALNALASRIRGLQQRAAQSGQLVHRTRRVLPGRHFAFQLAELNGCIWYRQGWLDVAGELVPVGDAEWNLLGGMKPCTVWLNITRGEDGTATGTVEQGELDLTTPEKNTRRRLGYVRTEEAQDDFGAIWHAVQVLGGVIAPCAPRRQMGTPAASPPTPEKFGKSDGAMNYMHAGSLTGGGYSVGGEAHAPRRVILGYSNDLRTMELPALHGGTRFTQIMSFATNI